MTDSRSKADLVIDGLEWNRVPGIQYLWPYERIFAEESAAGATTNAICAELFKQDLWFLLYFGMRVSIANNPWWVQCCRDVQNGPKSHTLDLWAREHGKTTIITQGETIRQILNNPEERIGIFSYSRPAALSILRGIKQILEGSSLLKACFPGVLYQDPRGEADKWSETDGLIVKRKGFYKEATLEAHGLIEGMPVGKHFSGRIYDDVVTQDLVNSPDVMAKLHDTFDMSQNLGTIDGWHKVIGTTYHHEDLLVKLRNKITADGKPVYLTRVKPATVDGTPNGASAYLPEERLAELRINKQMFFSQQLLDPTPQGTQKLDSSLLVEVSPAQIPQRLFKFMLVDPAGERKSDKRQGDSWAMGVIGVEPYRDDLGNSNIYVLDLLIEPQTESEAIGNVVSMFMRNGQIRQLGVEKVGLSTAETHISKALLARGRSITLENKGLVLLRPGGRSKQQRIESALQYPLMHRKIHLSTAIPAAYRERLRLEMNKYPFWHDDGIDMLSYIYDVIKDYRFGKADGRTDEQKWDDAYQQRAHTGKPNGWLYV